MHVRCSPPAISYLCLRLRQPASSPATSQATSTSLLLGQRLSRGYFFYFSHLFFFIPLSFLFLLSLFLPLSFPVLSFYLSVCLPASVSLPRSVFSLSYCLEGGRVTLSWHTNFKLKKKGTFKLHQEKHFLIMLLKLIHTSTTVVYYACASNM